MPSQGALDLCSGPALPVAFDNPSGRGSIDAHCRSLRGSRLSSRFERGICGKDFGGIRTAQNDPATMIQESRITISAAEGLWEIGENNLTRRNFPIGGLKLDLVCNGRLLGSILRMNLLKLRKEAMFQFSGKQLRGGRSGGPEALGSNRQVEGAKKFGGLFSRVGPSGWDGFVVDVLWRRLFEKSEASRFMTEESLRVGRTVIVPEGLFASLPAS